ncbi:MAG: hypothetical protein ACR2NR_05895 [Solirubrobacteraceae bacterium]
MGRVWMRFAVGLLATAALVGGGFGAAQAAGGLGHNNPHRQKLEVELTKLLNSASRYVERHDSECRVRPPKVVAPRLVHGPPDRALLAALAILRRPAEPGDDRLLSFLRRPDPFTARIYVNYVRVAHAADGKTLILVPMRVRAFPTTPAVCLAHQHARVLELLEGKPRDLRRLTLRTEAQLNRQDNHQTPPRDGLSVFDRGGGGGGGVDATVIRRSGEFGASSSNHGPSDVDGVIPDGVVSITAIYDRAVTRGPYRNPKLYRSRVVRKARVQDNVVDFTVPRPADDGFPSRMIWHLANGRTRVVPQPH